MRIWYGCYVLREKGHLDEAIETLAEAIRLSPATEDPHKLESWIREREENKIRTRICPNCGHANPVERMRCEYCEGETSFGKAILKSFKPGETKRILMITAVTFVILAIPLFLFSHLLLPYQIMIACVILLLLLVGFLVRMHTQP